MYLTITQEAGYTETMITPASLTECDDTWDIFAQQYCRATT